MDLTSVVPAAGTALRLVGSLIDRYRQSAEVRVDADALMRLLLLEARRNAEVLRVVVGGSEPCAPDVLWGSVPLLSVEVLEALLSRDVNATRALAALRGLTTTPESDDDSVDVPDAATFAMRLYVRATALAALATLNSHTPLPSVRIALRLRNLHKDYVRLLGALASRDEGTP